MNNRSKFVIIILLLTMVLGTGIIGYSILLHLKFIDALYMTVITISTVGYGEVGVMTDQAKLFSIFIIFAGLSIFGYGITSLISLFFEGELKDAWRKKKMETKIQELNEHYIVCGAGEVSRTVMNCFQDSQIKFVVIEENEKRAEELKKSGILTVIGDATHEETLKKAGIVYAKGIVCGLPTDAENVFTVLTAREMNEDIYIVSKAIEISSHKKLLKAGANKTISPNEIGGQRIAALIIRPAVISFLDVITRAGDITLDLEEVEIKTHSSIAGLKLYQAKIPEQTGLIILALKSKNQSDFRFNPSSNETLFAGDTMVVLGTKGQVEKLNTIVNHH